MQTLMHRSNTIIYCAEEYCFVFNYYSHVQKDKQFAEKVSKPCRKGAELFIMSPKQAAWTDSILI